MSQQGGGALRDPNEGSITECGGLIKLTRAVPVGEPITALRPVLLAQDPFNSAGQLRCTKCGAACGSTDMLIDFLRERISLVDAKKLMNGLGPVLCSSGCGGLYCSDQCRQQDFGAGHKYLCVGAIDEQEHPLVQFKIAALLSGCFETIYMAAQVFAGLIAAWDDSDRPSDPQIVASMLQKATAKFSPLFSPSATAPWDASQPEPYDEELFRTVFDLLVEGLEKQHSISIAPSTGAPSVFGGALTFDLFGRICGDLLRWTTEVSLPSPLIAHCESLHEKLGFSGVQLDAEVARIRDVLRTAHANDELNAEDADDAEDATVTEVADVANACASGSQGDDPIAATSDESAVAGELAEASASEEPVPDLDDLTADDLVCDARRHFDGIGMFRGRALFLTLPKLRHSCNASTEMEFRATDSGIVGNLVASDDLTIGSELTVSHADCEYEADKSDRDEILASQFGSLDIFQRSESGRCACEKCLVQTHRADEVTADRLHALLRRDLRQSFDDDSDEILNSISRRNEDGLDDALTLYQRAKIASWRGEWQAAEKLWGQARQRFATHPRFAAHMYHHVNFGVETTLHTEPKPLRVDDYVEAVEDGKRFQGRVACCWEDGTYNVLG